MVFVFFSISLFCRFKSEIEELEMSVTKLMSSVFNNFTGINEGIQILEMFKKYFEKKVSAISEIFIYYSKFHLLTLVIPFCNAGLVLLLLALVIIILELIYCCYIDTRQ